MAALQAAAWLLALAAALVVCMDMSYLYIENSGSTYYAYPSFIEQLRLCGMVQYWQARCAWDKTDDPPSAVLLDDTNSAYYAMNRAYEQGSRTFSVGYGSAGGADAETDESYGGLALWEQEAAASIDLFNQEVLSLQKNFENGWHNLHCTLIDGKTGRVYAPGTDLSGFVLNDVGFDKSGWEYVVAVHYGALGELLSVFDWTASTARHSAQEHWFSFSEESSDMTEHLSESIFRFYDFAPPRDVTMIFAIPERMPVYDALAQLSDANRLHRFYGEYSLCFFGLLSACVLLALWFGRRRGSGLGAKRLAGLFFEVDAAGLGFAFGLGGSLVAQCLYSLFDGSISQDLQNNFSVDLPAVADAMAFAMAVAVTAAFFTLTFLSALALRQGVARFGWKGYLSRRTLAGQALRLARLVWRRTGRQIVRLWGALTRVDLRDSADRTLARLLAVNFVIVTFICCFWVLGILGTIVYTVVLFFLLRGRLRREQQHYAALLDAARRMAAGDLTTPITGELGMFNPLRDELNEVRDGFEKAVAAEVRSQNMKTELISNVSHDLKTPLTAIITYVDLLKDPALPEADRARYIDTLDRKSQRLKRLIEDLFEVSKAATGNVTMHYTEVDLAALLKQMQYELADKLQSCGIDFRWQLPEGRVPLVLDGEKTCRIFENLLVNITKYGMPGTRAYITLTPLSDGARIVFKNVSAAELEFDPQHITERFVRGDKSRNTEGSGLGLAIVKSFAELQGGSFEVAADGDLFKAIVTLPGGNVPEPPELPVAGAAPARPPVLPVASEEL